MSAVICYLVRYIVTPEGLEMGLVGGHAGLTAKISLNKTLFLLKKDVIRIFVLKFIARSAGFGK